jgi:hypothetical protein
MIYEFWGKDKIPMNKRSIADEQIEENNNSDPTPRISLKGQAPN